MTEEEAFLQAIRESPEENGLRLMHADWLEEYGDPKRAEFIRVQCELADLAPDTPGVRALRQREQALLLQHEDTWRAELPPLPGINWGAFQRGFIGCVEALCFEAFAKWAPAVCRYAPIHEVALRSVSRSMAQVADCPHLQWVTSLDLAGNRIDAHGVAALGRSPYLRRLRMLNLGYNQLGTVGARALAKAGENLPSLESLDLRNNQIGSEGVEAIVVSPGLRQVVHLWLDQNAFELDGVKALIDCPQTARLDTLSLRRCGLDALGAWGLMISPSVCPKHLLDLAENWITPPDFKLPETIESPGGLGTLVLAGNRIQASEAVWLATWQPLARFRGLDLSDNEIDDEGTRALATSAAVSDIERISLQRNHIGDNGAVALAVAHLPRLHSLDLSFNRIGERGAVALVQSATLCGIERLLLNSNPLGRDGGEALEWLPELERLTELGLKGCGITPETAGHLVNRLGDRLEDYPD